MLQLSNLCLFSDTAETWSPSTRTPTYSTCGRSSQYWSPVSSSWSHLISSHPGSPRIISSGATSSCTSSSSTSSTPLWCPSTWRGQFPGSFPKRMWALAAFTRGSPKIWNPGVQYQSRAEEGAISLVEKEQILQRGPPEPSLNRSKNGKLTKPRKSCQSSQIKHSGFNLLEKPTDSFQQENRSSGPANRTLAIGCFCTPGTMWASRWTLNKELKPNSKNSKIFPLKIFGDEAIYKKKSVFHIFANTVGRICQLNITLRRMLSCFIL